MDTTTPKPGDLRVWHIPQIPGKAFHVPVATEAEGRKVCFTLAAYDAFQYAENIKPDYCNSNGVQRYEDDGYEGFDWFDIEDEEDEV